MLLADFIPATLDRGGIRRSQTRDFSVNLDGKGVQPTLIARNEGQVITLGRRLSC
jgi:hypothetical protein